MKKFIAVLAVFFSLASCDVEPLDPVLFDSIPVVPSVDDDLIIGDWEYEDYDIVITRSTNIGGTVTDEITNIRLNPSSTGQISFSNDGNFATDGMLEVTVTGASAGAESADIMGRSGSYRILQDLLTGSIPFTGETGEDVDFRNALKRITELTNSTMELEFEGSYDVENMGVITTVEFDGFALFSKI
ncbi:MAG: hypothetical protein WBA16_06615 [Nonlabens sp.]